MLVINNRTLHSTGSSLIEILVILPVFLIVTLGVVQFIFIYEVKSTLNYATFMAARSGAVNHVEKKSIVNGLVKSLIPIYSPSKNNQGILAAERKAFADINKYSSISIINPTQEAFRDFAVRNHNSYRNEIPNDMLHMASSKIGASSGVNIQDANLLKIRVLYGYKLQVPFVDKIITIIARKLTSNTEELYILSNGRLPIQATATVRMQSAARSNDWVQSRKR